MVTYETKHSTGLVKVRKSRLHKSQRYTHALWARSTISEDSPRFGLQYADGLWHCVSIASNNTVANQAAQYAKAGHWEIEVAPVTATIS